MIDLVAFLRTARWGCFISSIYLLPITIFAQQNLSVLMPSFVYENALINQDEVNALADKLKKEGMDRDQIEEEINVNFYFTEYGDSWYNCGGPSSVIASSTLPQGTFNYEAGNAHDFDLRTAWVEGDEGKGIGAYLEYVFESSMPITDVVLVNGYVKSRKAWEENSRVKSFKMYINDEPTALLLLQDTTAYQRFSIGEYQPEEGKPLTFRFEIIDVYLGSKYEDVAVTELQFDGTGCLCLDGSTMIIMARGSKKAIKELSKGDVVKVFDPKLATWKTSEVEKVSARVHREMLSLMFDRTKIIATPDHPFLVEGKGWCSFKPNQTKVYDYPSPKKYEVGDKFTFMNESGKRGEAVLQVIELLDGVNNKSYTLHFKDGSRAYIANGLISGVEHLSDTERSVQQSE